MAKEPDNRFYFVRNTEDLAVEETKHLDVEYEVMADSHIVGDLDYGPYNFTIWEMHNLKSFIEPEGHERKLCFRIRHAATSDEDSRLEDSATKRGFYHGGGIPEELVSFASLLLRRRLRLGPLVRFDGKPRMWASRGPGWIDRPLIAGQSNLEDLKKKLPLVERLSPKFHQKFILAARMYHRALLLVEEEPDLAYLNLVSAVEVLCQDTDIGKFKLEDLEGYKKIAKLIARVEDQSLRGELEEALLAKERFIKKRFVQFVLDHVEEGFWSEDERWPEENRPACGRVQPEDLEHLLKKVYDQRSATLHSGEAFPPSTYSIYRRREELDTSSSRRQGQRLWERKDYIPTPMFFERLINHVLLTFLKRNQPESATQDV